MCLAFIYKLLSEDNDYVLLVCIATMLPEYALLLYVTRVCIATMLQNTIFVLKLRILI